MKKQLLLFVLIFLPVVANAFIGEVKDRFHPIPVTQKTFVVGNNYYIYNVGRGMFVNKGEAWGTQATLGYQGMMYQVRHDADMPEGYYYLYSEETNKNNKVMWRTNGDGNAGLGVAATFVDNNKGDNAYWTIKPFNDNVMGGFIIQIPEDTNGSYPFVETQAWGAQWNHWGKFFDSNGITNGIFFDVEIANNPDNVTWQFVTVNDYEDYQDGLDTEAIEIWNAANDLQDAIDQASEYDVDATEAQAVLDNPDADAAEMYSATADLIAQIEIARTPIVGDVRYKLDVVSKVATVISSNYSGEIVIPATIINNGVEYNVTSIGQEAFYKCTRLTSVTIPNSVNTIGQQAFWGCI